MCLQLNIETRKESSFPGYQPGREDFLSTKTFGERIKALRKQNNMTQEQLAEALYLENKATISSYENNRRMPSADILSEMARVLGTTIDYLLNGEKEENETINQVVQIMEVLSPELQQLALEQVKLLGLFCLNQLNQ